MSLTNLVSKLSFPFKENMELKKKPSRKRNLTRNQFLTLYPQKKTTIDQKLVLPRIQLIKQSTPRNMKAKSRGQIIQIN